MIAAVVETKKKYVTILTEDNNTHKLTHDDKNFKMYQEFYETESLFEFNPLTRSIISLDIKKGELEDFTLPEDF